MEIGTTTTTTTTDKTVDNETNAGIIARRSCVMNADLVLSFSVSPSSLSLLRVMVRVRI